MLIYINIHYEGINYCENTIIKTNIHIQHICLTDFAIRKMHRTYDATFPINT